MILKVRFKIAMFVVKFTDLSLETPCSTGYFSATNALILGLYIGMKNYWGEDIFGM